MNTIIIVGAGMAGLYTALVLSARGYHVHVLEKKAAEETAMESQTLPLNVVHGQQAQLLLADGVAVLESEYPDLWSQLLIQGARRIPFRDLLPNALLSDYEPIAGDERLLLLGCRYQGYEAVLLDYLASLDNVTLHFRTQVLDVVARWQPQDQAPNAEQLAVVLDGVVVESDGMQRTLHADIVVDCSGRLTRFPRWLQEYGCLFSEDCSATDMVYYTRHYCRLNGDASRVGDVPIVDLGYLWASILPADNGHFSVALALSARDHALNQQMLDATHFEALCQQLPNIAEWLDDDYSVATGPVLAMADNSSYYRRFYGPRHQQGMLNFFAVGDAMVCTNPIHQRGVTLALLQARCLAEVLAEEASAGQRVKAYGQALKQRVRPIYDHCVLVDAMRSRCLALDKARSAPNVTLKVRFMKAAWSYVLMAAWRDVAVYRRLAQVMLGLAAPNALRNSEMLGSAWAGVFKGSKARIAWLQQHGPKRCELLDSLVDQVGVE